MEIRSDDHDGNPIILARAIEEIEASKGAQVSSDEATVSGTLYTIARIVEDQNPGFLCSILLVADGKFVRGAGPSLPEEYNAAIDGFAVGPTVGSCGTAISWNVPVIAEDIQTDPLWTPFAELAKKAGVASCWSHPFASRSGSVLGALALYSPTPRAPSPEQLARLKAAARMTGLAVERGRAEEALRAQRRRELELEEKLRQAVKMEALGVLAGGVAHDFNNILATILANAEFSRELLAEDSPVQDRMTAILEASKRAGQFCHQMLSYAGRGSFTRSQIEIGALIPELSHLVRAAISKNTTLEYKPIERPIHVDGDENQLMQVIMNLVTNAAEAIGDSEGRIVVRTELASYDDDELRDLDPQTELSGGEYLRLSVTDTGVGMDSETVSRIFDPFYTTKTSGHGLGLSAVKGIVTQHGGAILIDSTPGKGTTFTVVLPTVEFNPRTESSPSAAQDLGCRCILVADDEPALRDIISMTLRHFGLEVHEAADGQEAIRVFLKHRDSIDCVLLDYSMPKLSGEETLQALRAVRENVPVIMLSGYSEQEIVDRFQDAGIASCLQKPVPTETLLEAIRMAMGKGS